MPMNVLIVDDSPAMRRFVRRVLELSGLDLGACREASDGEEALEALRGEMADVILTDINMPRMDGEELVRRLKGDERLRSIPVIVVSTDQTDGRVRRMLDLGARGYVKKPFTPETLRGELEQVLEVGYGSG